jgi:hypothetical protein
MTQPPDLDAIQAREQAASAAPWVPRPHAHAAAGYCRPSRYEPTVGWTVDHPHALHCDDLVARHPTGDNDFGRALTSCDEGPLLSYEDAVFAAHARADVPALLAENARLRAQQDALVLAAEAVHTELHALIVNGTAPRSAARAAWTDLDAVLGPLRGTPTAATEG